LWKPYDPKRAEYAGRGHLTKQQHTKKKKKHQEQEKEVETNATTEKSTTIGNSLESHHLNRKKKKKKKKKHLCRMLSQQKLLMLENEGINTITIQAAELHLCVDSVYSISNAPTYIILSKTCFVSSGCVR
jgi:magnesium-transporting ATPase (P-type)